MLITLPPLAVVFHHLMMVLRSLMRSLQSMVMTLQSLLRAPRRPVMTLLPLAKILQFPSMTPRLLSVTCPLERVIRALQWSVLDLRTLVLRLGNSVLFRCVVTVLWQG